MLFVLFCCVFFCLRYLIANLGASGHHETEWIQIRFNNWIIWLRYIMCMVLLMWFCMVQAFERWFYLQNWPRFHENSSFWVINMINRINIMNGNYLALSSDALMLWYCLSPIDNKYFWSSNVKLFPWAWNSLLAYSLNSVFIGSFCSVYS